MIKKQGVRLIAGIDEAGRGPLAGPVYAGAVILDPAKPIQGLADSKILSAKQREALFTLIKENALVWSYGIASVSEIDSINILQATFLAMQRAVQGLGMIPELALIDGNQVPQLLCKSKAIIEGDKTEPAISAASIIAKVLRDAEMIRLDGEYPQYGFAKHKGYGTKEHLKALKEYGPCSIHRKTYAPVAKELEKVV